ncbi:MAG TPA: helix-turn-helix transcriptional regulator [Burkholderiales bacterium]|nr:helix-turn-helix transcriptional regulator [Burkholderiales bacterium]
MARGKKSINKLGNKVVLALLRQVRLDAGLSQAELGKLLGRPQTYVSDVEIAERRADVLQVVEWCRACGVSFTSFARRLERGLAALHLGHAKKPRRA